MNNNCLFCLHTITIDFGDGEVGLCPFINNRILFVDHSVGDIELISSLAFCPLYADEASLAYVGM